MRPGVVLNHRAADSPAPGAWVLALVALGYGLSLWILSAFTIVHYNFAEELVRAHADELREAWNAYFNG